MFKLISLFNISDLFNKVCQSSGSAFNNWATSNPSIRCTFRLAEALGCESKDPAEVKAFLKKVSSQEIMDASSTKVIDLVNGI